MRINEVSVAGSPNDSDRLLGLAKFLASRAEDTNAQKQISKAAFISAARSLGIMLTPDTIDDVIAKPPLNGIFEPANTEQPDSLFYKGADIGAAKMSVPQAQQVVNKMAKSALNRDRSP